MNATIIHTIATQPNDFVRDSGIECVDRCPYENREQTLKVASAVLAKLQFLQDNFPHDEFLVYGNADKIKENEYLLKDIMVPEQKVGGASVDDIKVRGVFNTVIHKHPTRTNHRFSSTDEQFINSNHMFSVLIGTDTLNNIVGTCRIKMDCNRYMNQKLKIVFDFMNNVPDSFKSEMNNIKHKSWADGIKSWLTAPAFGKANP